MAAALRFAADLAPLVRDYLGYRVAADALMDPRGRLVRCTPWRRTVMQTMPDGSRLFCKYRSRRRSDAMAEWRALQELARIGIQVPEPLFLAVAGSASVVGMAGVPGRPMDAWFGDGRRPRAAMAAMPQLLRRLHDAGWVYRDMYWNHVFSTGAGARQPQSEPLASLAGDLWLVDVERAFQPTWRHHRWIVKDLAGLLSSAPRDCTAADALRFLRGYLGGLQGDWRRLARQVAAKSERIRAHVTKYPG